MYGAYLAIRWPVRIFRWAENRQRSRRLPRSVVADRRRMCRETVFLRRRKGVPTRRKRRVFAEALNNARVSLVF